eukprot:gene3662-4560_t
MLAISSEEEWDKWYNPNDVDQNQDDESLHQLLKKGCNGEIEGKEYEVLKNLLLEQSIEDRHKSQYRARYSIYPSEDKSLPIIQFSKYHIDFSFKEGEKCKVGVVLKDKIRINNRSSSSKVSFSFSNIPMHSPNIKLSFTPSSGVIKKNSSIEIQVEMVVLCTTKVRELVAVDVANSGRHLFTIKIDSKMSQVLDYKEIEMLNAIGGGGYGAIYRAKWRGLAVAVKVISDLNADSGAEFEKELEMHKELLHHPNIVHFVGFCVSPKCLVLEFVEGGSLDKYLQDPQIVFSPELRLKMAYDIAKGMCFLHRNEILHLDLKPQNFLVVSLSLQAPVSIKLADFGLATASTRSFYGPTVEGSFLYMSPEVFNQKKFSRAADVWSYGACLIEILTGKRPYAEHDHVGYLELARVREEGLPPNIPSEIEGELKKLIEACLHKDHTKRPSFDQIESFLEHKTEEIFKHSQSIDINQSNSNSSPLTILSSSPSFSSNSSVLSSSVDSNSSNNSNCINSNFETNSTSSTPTHKYHILPNLSFSSLSSLTSSTNSSSASSSPSTSLPNTPTGAGVGVPISRKIQSLHQHNRPAVPPRSSSQNSFIIQNKVSRAMTEVSISDTPKVELPPRSVTISSSNFVPPNNNLLQTQQPPNPPPPPKPHRPLPKPVPKIKVENNNNQMTPDHNGHPVTLTPVAKPTTIQISNGPSSVSLVSKLSKNFEQNMNLAESTSAPPTTSPSSPTSSSSPVNIKSKPISTSSSSTPQLPIPVIHKPPIRAASAFEIKNSISKSAPSSSTPSTPTSLNKISPNKPQLPTTQSTSSFLNNNNNNNNSHFNNSQQPHHQQHHFSKIEDTESLSIDSTDSMDASKFFELRSRSLKWLKDTYYSFLETLKSFSEIKTLKDCIELGQRIRDFKKDLELLCIDHLKIGWDTIHESKKKINQKPHLSQIPIPHPSYFDGDTYNKVVTFRDAALIVGESALDGLFYLITQLSPSHQQMKENSQSDLHQHQQQQQHHHPNQKLTQSEKETILKVAKITRDQGINTVGQLAILEDLVDDGFYQTTDPLIDYQESARTGILNCFNYGPFNNLSQYIKSEFSSDLSSLNFSSVYALKGITKDDVEFLKAFNIITVKQFSESSNINILNENGRLKFLVEVSKGIIKYNDQQLARQKQDQLLSLPNSIQNPKNQIVHCYVDKSTMKYIWSHNTIPSPKMLFEDFINTDVSLRFNHPWRKLYFQYMGETSNENKKANPTDLEVYSHLLSSQVSGNPDVNKVNVIYFCWNPIPNEFDPEGMECEVKINIFEILKNNFPVYQVQLQEHSKEKFTKVEEFDIQEAKRSNTWRKFNGEGNYKHYINYGCIVLPQSLTSVGISSKFYEIISKP